MALVLSPDSVNRTSRAVLLSTWVRSYPLKRSNSSRCERPVDSEACAAKGLARSA